MRVVFPVPGPPVMIKTFSVSAFFTASSCSGASLNGSFWRSQVIQQIGPFDENLHLTMDYDYSLRVGKQYNLYVLNEYLAAFRVHPASKSEEVRKHFDEDLAIAQRHTRSGFLVGLHRLHNQLIIFSYLRMQKLSNHLP